MRLRRWLHSLKPTFDLDPANIEKRLKSRLTPVDVFCIAFLIAWLFILLSLRDEGVPYAYDFKNYMRTADGDYSFYYYGYWLLPFFQLLNATAGVEAGFVIWGILNIFGILFATRVFNGKFWIIALSYQMLFVLFY